MNFWHIVGKNAINHTLLLWIGISWSCKNYCWFTSVFWSRFCSVSFKYFVLCYVIWWFHPSTIPRNYPLNEVMLGFQSSILLKSGLWFQKCNPLLTSVLGLSLFKGQELGICPHYHGHYPGYFERKQEEKYFFSVLFDYHSAIEVNYVHKIKKEMRQGSLRKTVKLMNRTTFKNYMT